MKHSLKYSKLEEIHSSYIYLHKIIKNTINIMYSILILEKYQFQELKSRTIIESKKMRQVEIYIHMLIKDRLTYVSMNLYQELSRK